MNDAVLALTRFGFTAYEAKAYLALLQKSPAIGYEVSKIANIPTAKIYETLANLKRKGAVLVSAQEPVLYYPVAPDVLKRRVREDFDESLLSLDGLLRRVKPLPDIDIVWNLSGYRAVVERMQSVIQNAETDLLVSLWPEEAAAVREQLAAAEHRGVRVVAGIFGAYDPGCARTVCLDSCGQSSFKRLGRRLNVATADSREAVVSEVSADGSAAGIWATTPCVVLTAKEYIRHDIWGKFLVDEVGKERFDKLCQSNETLMYLLKNR